MSPSKQNRKPCQAYLLRYVPNPIAEEFINFGVVLVEEGGFAGVRFCDLRRVSRLDPHHDKDLTEADKKQLKDFYLQNMIAPRARKILEQHLAHEMQKDRVHHRMTPADRRRRDAMRNSPPNPNTPNRPASPDRNNTHGC